NFIKKRFLVYSKFFVSHYFTEWILSFIRKKYDSLKTQSNFLLRYFSPIIIEHYSTYQLTSLDLSTNDEVVRKKDVQKLIHLTTLDLSGKCALSITDETIIILTNLTNLRLCFKTDITNNGIRHLTKLRTLHLGN